MSPAISERRRCELLAEFLGSSVGILIATGRDESAVEAAALAYHYAGRAARIGDVLAHRAPAPEFNDYLAGRIPDPRD